jgi:ATP-binding protein involved in chromosome partitioning
MAAQFHVPFLGEISLVQEICAKGDSGTPLVLGNPEHPQSRAFLRIAAQVLEHLPEKRRRQLPVH